MPKSVKKSVETIINMEEGIEKSVSSIIVLFCDLVGSTRFKAQNSVVEGLKRVFTFNKICTEKIIAHQGTIIKYIGDEVMSTFNKADQAIQAAMEIHESLSKLHGKPPFECKIGIHAGDVYYFDYPQTKMIDPQGTTVDIAARIVSTANPCQILISNEVHTLTKKNGFKFSKPVSFIPKGFHSKLFVYAVNFPKANLKIQPPPYMSYLSENGEALVNQAKQYIKDQKFLEAINTSKQILELDEENVEANYIIGCCIANGIKNDIDYGVSCLEKVLQNNPNHFRAMHFLAYLLWRKFESNKNNKFIPRILALSNACLSLSEKNEDRHTALSAKANLAYYLVMDGKKLNVKKSLVLCEDVEKYFLIKEKKMYSYFLDTFGYVCLADGQLEHAEELFKKAMALNESSPYPYQHMADLKKMQEEKKSSKSDRP